MKKLTKSIKKKLNPDTPDYSNKVFFAGLYNVKKMSRKKEKKYKNSLTEINEKYKNLLKYQRQNKFNLIVSRQKQYNNNIKNAFNRNNHETVKELIKKLKKIDPKYAKIRYPKNKYKVKKTLRRSVPLKRNNRVSSSSV